MKIIAAVDGSEQQPDAPALAAQLADLHGAELLVAHVYPPHRRAYDQSCP